MNEEDSLNWKVSVAIAGGIIILTNLVPMLLRPWLG